MTTAALPFIPDYAGPETYINSSHTIRSWLLTKDHKRIAILYMITITFMFMIAAGAAALIRINLLSPNGVLSGARPIQQGLLHPWHPDGLVVPGAVDPDGDGKLPHPADDRRPRPGLPATQSGELVPVCHLRDHDPCA